MSFFFWFFFVFFFFVFFFFFQAEGGIRDWSVTGVQRCALPILQAQDPWTPVGGDVTLRFDIAHAPPGATLNLTPYQALTARSEFDSIAQGNPPKGALTGGLELGRTARRDSDRPQQPARRLRGKR